MAEDQGDAISENVGHIHVEKRVELHLHTVMSDNDSVVQIKDIVNRAYEWGHPAVAITDHGVLQGFPIARHAYET